MRRNQRPEDGGQKAEEEDADERGLGEEDAGERGLGEEGVDERGLGEEDADEHGLVFSQLR